MRTSANSPPPPLERGVRPSAALGPDMAVIAGAAGNALAIVQAAEAAGRALAAWEQAAQGKRVLKAAASGRRAAPATRPGGLRDLVEGHLRAYPDLAFTPHQVGKVLGGRSAGAVTNALDKLVSLGIAELATDKPRSFRLPPRRPPSQPRGRSATSAREPRPAPPDGAARAARPGRRGRCPRPRAVTGIAPLAWPGARGTSAGARRTRCPTGRA
jgi:hypothetical protein